MEDMVAELQLGRLESCWKLRKRESPGLLSPNTGEARTDPGNLWGTAFIIFLKLLLSRGLRKLRIISLGYCSFRTMSYALFWLQLLCSLLSLGTLSQRLGQSIQEIMERRQALSILGTDDGNLGGGHH